MAQDPDLFAQKQNVLAFHLKRSRHFLVFKSLKDFFFQTIYSQPNAFLRYSDHSGIASKRKGGIYIKMQMHRKAHSQHFIIMHETNKCRLIGRPCIYNQGTKSYQAGLAGEIIDAQFRVKG